MGKDPSQPRLSLTLRWPLRATLWASVLGAGRLQPASISGVYGLPRGTKRINIRARGWPSKRMPLAESQPGLWLAVCPGQVSLSSPILLYKRVELGLLDLRSPFQTQHLRVHVDIWVTGWRREESLPSYSVSSSERTYSVVSL